MQDRRKTKPDTRIPPDLLAQGKTQLEAEIKIIEGWLADLEGTRDDNSESAAAKKSYNDMLQSRRELLSTLNRQ
ncbi:MAG: hypothetical protein RQ899_13275 [Pseudomonadales bacterium]|nr:hypothetical protein [Pseudomonadales bacterium]